MPSSTSPRILIIGAGSRGYAYARAIHHHTTGTVVGVAEPIEWNRNDFVKRYAADKFVYSSWTEILSDAERVKAGVDAICVCTLDETHADIVTSLRPLNLHILCEKPLATTFDDSQRILRSVQSGGTKPILLAIGHVLRYSPHNLLLHKLVVQDAVIGDVININHTEPVGWWHFAHSYVRGNWRSSRRTAPSLLTKCCHDIDLLLWLLCSPTESRSRPHLPSRISSHGSLTHFRPVRKPKAAGQATNCFSCPAEPDCNYSARKIYIATQLYGCGNISGWPNKIVVPALQDIEDIPTAKEMLTNALSKDYNTEEAGTEEVEKQSYYGRCVFEAGNDVVDNQVVVLEWEDMVENTETKPNGEEHANGTGPRHIAGSKIATLTMIAHSESICDRFTKIYGSDGEITADSHQIRVYDFKTSTSKIYKPHEHMDETGGHGGGDVGLAMAFVEAVREVLERETRDNRKEVVKDAQRKWIRCTPEEAVLSHAVVFAAEEARVGRKVVEVDEWAEKNQVDTVW